MGTTARKRALFGAQVAVYAAIMGAGATPRPAQAQAFSGQHQIIDGPGAGIQFNAVAGAVNGGGLVGQIEDHGGNCNGPHFHGIINGQADPNPVGCGWGHVIPFSTNGGGSNGGGSNGGNGSGHEHGTEMTRDHLGQTADPHAGGPASPFSGLPSDNPRLAALLLEIDRGGASLPKLRGDIAPVTAATTTNPNLDPAIVQDETKQRLQSIFTTFKGTGDLAGVAEALYEFNRWYFSQTGKPYYEWAGEGKNYTNSPSQTTGSDDRFMLTTQLACYEFVHFCAYIASDQPQAPRVVSGGEHFDSEGNLLDPPVYDPNHFTIPWGFPTGNPSTTVGNGTRVGDIVINETAQDARDDPNKVQRGQVVTGIGRWSNNDRGYNHVGIAIGNGQVISLGSGGLEKEEMGGTFGGAFSRLGFNFVYAGDYQWQDTNPAPANPTVPLTTPGPTGN